MIELGKFNEEDVLNLARNCYDYGNANFPVIKNNCALIVIDMQAEFVKPNWTPYWVPAATRCVPTIKKLIQHCRKQNIPVIYTVFSRTNKYYDRPHSGKFMPNRYSDLSIDQSGLFAEGKVWHELEPLEDEFVIHKD